MKNKLKKAFEPICATEEMRENLMAFLSKEAAKGSNRAPVRPWLRYTMACCAVVTLIICGLGGYNFYQNPVSYISVDVNPSVELALNRFDRVVEVEAYNDDGTAVLENLRLENKPYTEAIELLLSDKTFESYLSDDSLLSFTVVSKKEAALLAGIQQCRGYSQTNSQCHSANADSMDDAHQSGLSFGKYQAYLELLQYDETITPEECRHLSMKELRDLINQYAGGDPLPTISVGTGSGHHHNNGCHGGQE